MKTIKKIELRVRRDTLAESKEPYSAAVRTPDDVARIVQSILKDVDYECFLAVPVDVKNKVLGYVEVAKGGIDLCPVDPREVFRAAVVMGASGIFLAHNHPSGDHNPSQEDDELTKRAMEAGKILNIPVVDHLVISRNGFYSYAEHGRLEDE